MQIFRRASIVFAAAALLGCAGAFKQPSPYSGYGMPPMNYKAPVKAYFDNRLKDAESARYRFGIPARAYANNGLAYGGDVAFQGYIVDLQVNAKNSFGGYTGFKPWVAYFSGDRLVKVQEGADQTLLTRLDAPPFATLGAPVSAQELAAEMK